MTFIRIERPGPPEVLVPDRMAVPRPGAGRGADQGRGGRRQPAGRAAAPGRLPAAARAPATCRASRSRARSWPWATASSAGARAIRSWRWSARGGYAEYCVGTRRRRCLPVPPGLSMVEAGGVPETFFTVWTNVFDRGRLQPGESFLVHGGSSGIGTTAIQLAHAFGATVFATVGSADKQRACEALGAAARDRLPQRGLRGRASRPRPAAAASTSILDMVGGAYVERNLQALAVEGRLVQIAWLQGLPSVQANFMPLMLKRLTWTGSTLRPAPVEQKGGDRPSRSRPRVWPLLAAGQVKPLIHATFPLARGGGRPRADGIERAYRQDRADRLSPWLGGYRHERLLARPALGMQVDRWLGDVRRQGHQRAAHRAVLALGHDAHRVARVAGRGGAVGQQGLPGRPVAALGSGAARSGTAAGTGRSGPRPGRRARRPRSCAGRRGSAARRSPVAGVAQPERVGRVGDDQVERPPGGRVQRPQRFRRVVRLGMVERLQHQLAAAALAGLPARACRGG